MDGLQRARPRANTGVMARGLRRWCAFISGGHSSNGGRATRESAKGEPGSFPTQ
jgi:hypothetical protein